MSIVIGSTEFDTYIEKYLMEYGLAYITQSQNTQKVKRKIRQFPVM